MINYELAKKQGPGLKTALTRAKKIANPEARYIAVRAACTKAVKAWEVWGAWPDAWATWQIALDDAHIQCQREYLRGIDSDKLPDHRLRLEEL